MAVFFPYGIGPADSTGMVFGSTFENLIFYLTQTLISPESPISFEQHQHHWMRPTLAKLAVFVPSRSVEYCVSYERLPLTDWSKRNDKN